MYIIVCTCGLVCLEYVASFSMDAVYLIKYAVATV